jgi:hypothetical protein
MAAELTDLGMKVSPTYVVHKIYNKLETMTVRPFANLNAGKLPNTQGF